MLFVNLYCIFIAVVEKVKLSTSEQAKMQENVLMIFKVSVLNKKDKESLSCHGSKSLLISRKMDSVVVKVDSREKSTLYLSETI